MLVHSDQVGDENIMWILNDDDMSCIVMFSVWRGGLDQEEFKWLAFMDHVPPKLLECLSPILWLIMKLGFAGVITVKLLPSMIYHPCRDKA